MVSALSRYAHEPSRVGTKAGKTDVRAPVKRVSPDSNENGTRAETFLTTLS